MENALRLCEDGSHTLFSERVGECYHSSHGAYTESVHIFINYGFRAAVERRGIKDNACGKTFGLSINNETNQSHQLLSNREPEIQLKPLRVLEVGFGTGLNALLTAIESEKEEISVSYMGLEPFPIHPDTLQQLNYCTFLSGNSEPVYTAMHASAWSTGHQMHPWFYFTKQLVGFMQAGLQNESFDLIYFDAFSPEVQPDLWEPEVFRKCFEVLAVDGILVTYCAKGRVKRALKSAGFTLENLPGPPGKREITRALKLGQ